MTKPKGAGSVFLASRGTPAVARLRVLGSTADPGAGVLCYLGFGHRLELTQLLAAPCCSRTFLPAVNPCVCGLGTGPLSKARCQSGCFGLKIKQTKTNTSCCSLDSSPPGEFGAPLPSVLCVQVLGCAL